jgi:hypothetical protein
MMRSLLDTGSADRQDNGGPRRRRPDSVPGLTVANWSTAKDDQNGDYRRVFAVLGLVPAKESRMVRFPTRMVRFPTQNAKESRMVRFPTRFPTQHCSFGVSCAGFCLESPKK